MSEHRRSFINWGVSEEGEESDSQAEEKSEEDDEIPVRYGYPSKIKEKKKMAIDPDGATMQAKGGERVLMKVSAFRQSLSKKRAASGALLICVIGMAACVLPGSTPTRYIPDQMKKTSSAFDYHDGANYGYNETTFDDGNSEQSGKYNLQHDEPMISGGITIPPYIDATFVDTFQPSDDGGFELTPFLATSGEYPFFWRVPNVGSRIENMLVSCVKAVLATSAFRDDERGAENALRVYNIEDRAYVNVDLSQTAGIERASDLNLAETGIADLFVTPHLHYASHKLLSFPEHKGRMFTVFRHPIERAIVSHSDFIKKHQADSRLAQMSLAEFAQSDYSSKDWLTRFLVNKRRERVTWEDVQKAKEILRKKFLIGLYDRVEESMERIERYFGWFRNGPLERECHQNLIAAERAHDTEDYMYEVGQEGSIDIGSEVYGLMLKNNEKDMEVYWYAVGLFEEQGKLFPSLSW
mmetsp:Transcript_33109/g.48589  ORF Transcript_33109/g.48589 Transcript_33109/m.48589 type:complete len:467 (-) Transcript_33109:335-1735(-)